MRLPSGHGLESATRIHILSLESVHSASYLRTLCILNWFTNSLLLHGNKSLKLGYPNHIQWLGWSDMSLTRSFARFYNFNGFDQPLSLC